MILPFSFFINLNPPVSHVSGISQAYSEFIFLYNFIMTTLVNDTIRVLLPPGYLHLLFPFVRICFLQVTVGVISSQQGGLSSNILSSQVCSIEKNTLTCHSLIHCNVWFSGFHCYLVGINKIFSKMHRTHFSLFPLTSSWLQLPSSSFARPQCSPPKSQGKHSNFNSDHLIPVTMKMLSPHQF